MEEKQPYECTEITELNPTFLYTWKGTRDQLTFEEPFHCHEDHIEMAFVLSGEGRYRFEDGVFPIREGDLLIINPGVRHQALACPDVGVPATEFFVGFSGIRLDGLPDNTLPVPGGGHVIHTGG